MAKRMGPRTKKAVLVDTREKRPVPVLDRPTRLATLSMGDYTIEGLQRVLAIETKRRDVADTRRVARQVAKMAALACPVLVVEATPKDILNRSDWGEPGLTGEQVLRDILTTSLFYRVPVVFAGKRGPRSGNFFQVLFDAAEAAGTMLQNRRTNLARRNVGLDPKANEEPDHARHERVQPGSTAGPAAPDGVAAGPGLGDRGDPEPPCPDCLRN